MWNMKTMLAKVLSMQAKEIEKAHRATSLVSTENSIKLDAMEFKISVLTQEVRILSHKLGILINHLKLSIW